MPHLDEATALAWVAGGLRGEALDAALAHVDACDECRLLVAAAAGAEAAPAEPSTIGRFVVEGVAGRGAMGIVYRGRDPRLDRPVAIKTLRGDAFDPPARARFEREARALARIDDPNVVRVYEVGERDGELYLAMELVDGATLDAWLAAAPRRPAEILAVYVQAAAGLLAAHQVGLVHRDFKPANAMIDADGRVRVTDFGLVHLDAAAPPPSSTAPPLDPTLTQTGMVLGTPAYLAPELFDGGADAADGPEPRSDQFSLCVALYEALAGHRPFEAADLRGLRAAIDRGPLPPRRPIARRVHRALRRGLAVAPRDRFPSMRELIDAIAPPSRRGLLAVAAIGVAVVAGGAIAYVATRPGASTPPPTTAAGCAAAETRWASVWNEPRKAALRAAVIDGWPATPPPTIHPKLASRWDGLGRVQATLATDGVRRFGEGWRSLYADVCVTATHEARMRRACLDDVVGRLDAILAEPPRRGFADRLRELETDRDRCTSHLVVGLDRPADELREQVERARAELASAAAARLRGHPDLALVAIDRAVTAGTETASPSLLAEAWLERGLALRDAGDRAAAIDAWHTAIASALQVSHHRVVRRAADELAAAYAEDAAGRAEAERWLRTAESLDGKLPPTDPERAERLLTRATLARVAGDRAAAHQLATEARALARDPLSDLTARIDRAISATSAPP